MPGLDGASPQALFIASEGAQRVRADRWSDRSEDSDNGIENTSRSRPSQAGQRVTSTAKTRANKAAQPSRRRERETVETPIDDVPVDAERLGTTRRRARALGARMP